MVFGRARWAAGLWVVLGSVPALSGCGDDGGGGGSGGFGTCPTDLPGVAVGRDCSLKQVPLLWDEPDGEQIEVMVVRYRSPEAALGQLWLLDGGPGGTGATYMNEQMLALYQSLGYDLYIPQHRGTGHSTPLYCTDPYPYADCGAELVAQWGDRLAGFHSREAGRDVGFLIEANQEPPLPTFVLGISYGTYWAQRYLQAYPDQAAGVMLDGVVPLGIELWASDPLVDEAARSIFSACRAEADCASAFGTEDPEAVAERVLAEAADPEVRCFGADGLDREILSQLLTLFVVMDVSAAIPGIIRRLDRCGEADQAELLVLNALLEELSATLSERDDATNNEALGAHVIRTDLMAAIDAVPLAELIAVRDTLVFRAGAAPDELLAELAEDWPVTRAPEPTELVGLATPLLLMNGGLDAQSPSPWARELAASVPSTLVEFPYVGHGVDLSLATLAEDPEPCSLDLKRAFMDDPEGTLDTGCVESLPTLDVAGKTGTMQYIAQSLFGTTRLLGTDTGAAPDPGAALERWPRPTGELPEALKSRLRRARTLGSAGGHFR